LRLTGHLRDDARKTSVSRLLMCGIGMAGPDDQGRAIPGNCQIRETVVSLKGFRTACRFAETYAAVDCGLWPFKRTVTMA